jgi:hypothetical protein
MSAEKKVNVHIEAKDKTGPLDSFLKSTGTGAGTCIGICLGIVVIIFVIAFIGGLNTYKTASTTVETTLPQSNTVNQNLAENNPPAKSVDSFCPQLDVPSDVVPKVCTTCSNSTHSIDAVALEEVGWNGWKWEKMSSFYGADSYYSLLCSPGSSEGENANYLYCNNVLANLTKSFSDEQGTVLRVEQYNMEWVFVPEGDTYRLSVINYADNMFDAVPDCTTKYVP